MTRLLYVTATAAASGTIAPRFEEKSLYATSLCIGYIAYTGRTTP